MLGTPMCFALTARVLDGVDRNPKSALLVAALALGAIAWLLLLWLRPLTLLAIYRTLKLTGDVPVFKFVGLRAEFLRDFLLLRRRVLDAWVARHREAAREHFSGLAPVTKRRDFVPIAVEFDSNRVEPTRESFSRAFASPKTRLLLVGEGGSGKSTLAFQLAGWCLSPGSHPRRTRLPVLIDRNVPEAENEDAAGRIVKAVAARLRESVGDNADLSGEFVERLLVTGRVLVLVDGLSELASETQQLFTPRDTPGFPVRRLIVTARRHLDLVATHTIKTIRIRGDQISAFVDAYLRLREERENIDDPELLPNCERLADMMLGRDVTALLATMFVDLMIDQSRGDRLTLPRTVIECMRDYAHRQCRDDAADPTDARARVDARRRLDAAHLVARECVAHGFRVGSARRARVEPLVTQRCGAAALNELESHAGLIESADSRQETVRFVLDPLAEYLGAWQICHDHGNNRKAWDDYLDRADKTDLEVFRPLAVALRDCADANQGKLGIPGRIIDRLRHLSGLDDERVWVALRNRRMLRLAGTLERRDAIDEDRVHAAYHLGRYGADAVGAAGPLMRAIRETADMEARIPMAEALQRIAPEGPEATAELVQLLSAAIPTEHPAGSESRQPLERTMAGMATREPKNFELLCAHLAPDGPVETRQTVLRILPLMGVAEENGIPVEPRRPAAAAAVPYLLPLLERITELDHGSRSLLLEVLEGLGPDAGDALPQLKSLWKDRPDALSESLLLGALCSVGGDADAFFEIAVKTLDATDTTPDVGDGKEDPDVRSRREAAIAALQNFPSRADAILPRLRDILEGEDDDYTKLKALRTLRALGEAGKGLAPVVVRAYKKHESGFRADFIRAMHDLRADDEDSLAWLGKRVKDEDDAEVAEAAARALADLGRGHDRAIRALVKAAKNAFSGLHGESDAFIDALLEMDAPRDQVLPMLRKAARDEEHEARIALLAFGEADERAVDAAAFDLFNARHDPRAARRAACALARLTPVPAISLEPAVRALREGISEAADVLAAMGPAAADAVPALTTAAASRDRDRARRARAALERLHQGRAEPVSGTIEALGASEHEAR